MNIDQKNKDANQTACAGNAPSDAAYDDARDETSNDAFGRRDSADGKDDCVLVDTPDDSYANDSHAEANGNAEVVKPSRMHLVLALVAGIALIAVPIFFWVHPEDSFVGRSDVGSADSDKSLSVESAKHEPLEADDRPKIALKLGDVWIDKCEKPGPGTTAPEQCDRQPWFEQALVRAIRENATCTPQRAGTMSIVMRVDHTRRLVDVFAGKSGAIRGKSAENTIACIKRSIPDAPWGSLDHEHTKYIIAVMASYEL